MPTYADRLRQQGFEQGFAKGYREGLRIGKRTTLRRLFELKFGDLSPEAIAKLDAADESDVDRFIERIVSADSLDSVFGR